MIGLTVALVLALSAILLLLLAGVYGIRRLRRRREQAMFSRSDNVKETRSRPF